MALNKQELEALYEKYLHNQCSSEELQALVDELGEDSPAFRQDLVMQLFDKTWEGLEVAPGQYGLAETVLPDAQPAGAPVIALPSRKTGRRWAIAAAVIFLVAAGGYFGLIHTRTPVPGIATQPGLKNDVPPGYSKAVLTLANGAAVILDSVHTGTLTQQGNTTVVNSTNGQLAYNTLDNASASQRTTEVLYNILATPRGGQYQLQLPDGSRVWLNASSSIRYPTAFTGTERRVEIKGEAYFEVAQNTAMPFKVAIITNAGNAGEVQVLGTHFNINAYDDEHIIKTTLLEGAVKISAGTSHHVLKPGQQAQLSKGEAIKVIDDADTEEAVAWKDGRFYFNGADIQTVMRQVSRWYDVDVKYEGSIPTGHYKGRPARDLSVSQMLKVVEYSGVKIRIEGKKIIVQE
jgi:hypothetical protein